MRNESLIDGIQNKITINFTLEKADIEVVEFETKYRMDYAVNQNLTSFFIVNYKNGYQKSNEKINQIVNKGFTHLRLTQKLIPQIYGELFFQIGFNDFLSIKERKIAGGGIRIKGKEKIKALKSFLGSGLMNEIEKYDDDENSNFNLIRSTNYLALDFQILENITFTNTVYYQVDISNKNDYRILYNSGFNFKLIKNLHFSMAINNRYDNEPQHNINKQYVQISNGITYHF
ncbi:MAG: DUF481 domain-containing protein [Candidatus Marinimicrobia bacterium]|nr:DUF481 domain-containing protein [Candidatus Neomarinimicrobiota bacterium]